MRCKALTWALILAHSWLGPFTNSEVPEQHPLQRPSQPDVNVRNIAIIGAGAAGSSAAYYLRQFSQDLDSTLINITIFDSNPRIGGRTTTVNVFDHPYYPVELGASIFVRVNHILYNLSQDFGFQTTQRIFQASPETKFDLGIWDGAKFVFTQASDDDDQSSWKGYWDIAKLLFKYGLSPVWAQRAMKTAVGKFLSFYNEPIFPFSTLQQAVEAADLLQYTGVTGEQVLTKAGVKSGFARDIVQASTRVNYAQNLGGIHGLEALVCLATEGAMAIEGGNWQIFDEAVRRSWSHIRLNTTVERVERVDSGHYRIDLPATESQISEDSFPSFDAVILAAPYQFSKIDFQPPMEEPPEEISYVPLHVTLFTSPRRLSPEFFGLTDPTEVPGSVLTTLPPNLDLGAARGIDAVGPTKFWSISTLQTIPFNPSDPESGVQYLYKIFSPQRLTATWLANLLGIEYTRSEQSSLTTHKDKEFNDPISNLAKQELSWFHEKLWHSYPYETPRVKFDKFTFDLVDTAPAAQNDNLSSSPFTSTSEPEPKALPRLKTSRNYQTLQSLCSPTSSENDVLKTESFTYLPRAQQRGKIYYTSSMESFISTMETSALAGMNVARLLVDELLLDEVLEEGEWYSCDDVRERS